MTPVDPDLLAAVIDWITAIPFSAWPQQRPVDGQLRPAMINRPDWFGFGAATDALVRSIAPHSHDRMLSVVMPGHQIDAHRDAQPWRARVHVPLTTNPGALVVVDGQRRHMAVGYAYEVDVTVLHAVENYGPTPRIHLMFDVA